MSFVQRSAIRKKSPPRPGGETCHRTDQSFLRNGGSPLVYLSVVLTEDHESSLVRHGRGNEQRFLFALYSVDCLAHFHKGGQI